MRIDGRIEHRYLERGVTEIWQRDARGELSHWKAFPRLRRSVHYAAGDLRTIHVQPSWELLATLIDPAERSHLKVSGTRRFKRGRLTVLEGELDHQQTRVLWNEQSGWAQEMVMGTGAKRSCFRLLSAEPCAPSACVPLDTVDFREIEFADLGDSENDPFVRTFLAGFTQRHSH